MIINIFNTINSIISSYLFLFVAETLSLFLKGYFLFFVLRHGLRSPKIQRPWVFLIVILISAMFADFAWIVSLGHKLFFPTMDYRPVLFVIRVAWFFAIALYQFLALFIESLIEKNNKISWYQKIYLCISSALCAFFFYISIFKYNDAYTRPPLEFTMITVSSIYLFLLIIPSMFTAFQKIRKNPLPKILKKQLKILIQAIIAPYIISDFIQLYPFSFAFLPSPASNTNVICLATFLITYGFYYAARKVMGLRFLNFQSHVQSPNTFNFIDNFKDILEQLGHTTSVREIQQISKQFFKDALNIPASRTNLYVRTLNENKDLDAYAQNDLTAVETIVENFINRHIDSQCSVADYLKRQQIMITDEISFSNFYDETDSRKEMLTFLEQINADIFLPIIAQQKIIGYIIVERDARLNELYSNIERDEMVVFTSYLGNIINLQQNKNLPLLIENEKSLREELFLKHQEISQYKESIRSFLRTSQQRKIGIIFYKNRQFIFGNQAGQELIGINPNTQPGHPLAQDLKKLARHVEMYKTSYDILSKDAKGEKMVFAGVPHLEHNSVIITISYPEISDIIKKQIELLRNPTEWDYLLYLETTKSGQLINELIPGSGEQLLNFKIDLLKTALSKKALLLEMPEDDLLPTVTILHHISLRENLHVIELESPEQNFSIAIKLFGINPILHEAQDQPLLEKLDNAGTLFIKNIHLLDIETQQHLAEFIRYGMYHIFKSDRKLSSNVRIICSTNRNLQTLVQEGKFSRTLFNELKKTTISMPSLISLSNEELENMVEEVEEQTLSTQAEFNNLLSLSPREKTKLISKERPMSLTEFRKKIQNLLIEKSKKNNIYQETEFQPAVELHDIELAKVARLGKKALQDEKVMAMLWDKFEKNQNKIAAFLGVNRSSVNRRCKDYNLV